MPTAPVFFDLFLPLEAIFLKSPLTGGEKNHAHGEPWSAIFGPRLGGGDPPPPSPLGGGPKSVFWPFLQKKIGPKMEVDVERIGFSAAEGGQNFFWATFWTKKTYVGSFDQKAGGGGWGGTPPPSQKGP